MSREGIGMRKVKEIIRLNESGKLSQNAIAKSCKVSSSTVGKVLKKLNEKDVKKQVPGGGTTLSEQKMLAPSGNVRNSPNSNVPFSPSDNRIACSRRVVFTGSSVGFRGVFQFRGESPVVRNCPASARSDDNLFDSAEGVLFIDRQRFAAVSEGEDRRGRFSGYGLRQKNTGFRVGYSL